MADIEGTSSVFAATPALSLAEQSTAESSMAEITTPNSRVQVEILELIDKSNDPDEKPPFSTADMVVMAALCSEDEWLTFKEAATWILTTFSYYRQAAVDHFAEALVEGEDAWDPESILPGIQEVFDDWNVPVTDSNGEGTVKYDSYRTSDTFSVPMEAGRIYLSKWLAPLPDEAFRFLDLPAELRNRIYEYVFALPASGLGLQKWSGQHRVELMEREVDELNGPLDWTDDDVNGRKDTHVAPPIQHLLSLLLANKQIYDEAKAYFYELNHFVCVGFEDTVGFLTTVSDYQMMRLKKLSIQCSRRRNYLTDDRHDSVGNFRQAMMNVSRLIKAKKLVVNIKDNAWFNLSPHLRRICGRASVFTKVEHIPGMFQLAHALARAETFEVRGECPKICAWLEDAVMKIKAGEQLSEYKPRLKRKRDGTGQNGQAG